MTSGILAAVVVVFIGSGIIAIGLCRIADLADRDLPHPPEPPAGSLQARVDALRTMGDDVDVLWRGPEGVPVPHRKPGGGWVI